MDGPIADRWHHIFATQLTKDYDLYPAELDLDLPSGASGPMLAYALDPISLNASTLVVGLLKITLGSFFSSLILVKFPPVLFLFATSLVFSVFAFFLLLVYVLVQQPNGEGVTGCICWYGAYTKDSLWSV